MFDLDQFIADLRASATERSRQAMQAIVARAIRDTASLYRAIGTPDEAGAQVLYHGQDLTVLNIKWAPGQMTLPHNHMLGAVIGMYDGREDNVFWRKVPNPERFQIEAAGGKAIGSGDVCVLGKDIIHSVINPVSRISGAIHVYDGDFFNPHRSMWAAETLTEEPYEQSRVSSFRTPLRPA